MNIIYTVGHVATGKQTKIKTIFLYISLMVFQKIP